jgi:tetraacyldisaccharide 4'-kinase
MMRLAAPRPPTSPWQRLYGAGHALRRRWYRGRARRLPRPVVSVGNLQWGGGGKTPLVAAIAAHLRDRGVTVCVLSRGHGGRGRGERVVSAGAGPLLPAADAGDEPVMLAGDLPGVAVVVGKDRFRAGLHALARLEATPGVFLLDDGFSHLALHRDLDLLALPAADPFGGGRLLPAGRLREPLAASARADAAVLTGAAEARAAGAGADLAAALRPYGFVGRGFASFTRAGPPVASAGAGAGALPVAGGKALLVSAIARPEGFATAARELDFAIVGELRFRDHYPFPAASLRRIEALAAARGATFVIATAKDGVKLRGRLGVPLVELPIRAEPEPDFWIWLDQELDLAIDRLRAEEA